MANVRTVIGAIPAAFDDIANFNKNNASNLSMLKLAFDTTGADLEIFTPQVDGYAAILGWQHCIDIDHTVTVAYADDAIGTNRIVLLDYRFKAGSGIGKDLNKAPLLIGPKGKSLLVRTSAQPLTAILYTGELRMLKI